MLASARRNVRAVVLPSMLLVVAACVPSASAAEARPFRVEGPIALRAYQGMVEEHLKGVLRSVRALAATSEAQSGSWEAIRPALEQLSNDLPTDATAWFAQPDGSYDSTAAGKSSETLSDREYFPTLLAGRDVIGSLVISRSTGLRSIIVATPVMKEGKVIAIVGVSVQALLVSDLVSEQTKIPSNMTFYALDEKGQTAIHRDPKLMFEYPSDLGDESLKTAVEEMLSKSEGVVRYRWAGNSRTAVFNKSALLDWRFVLVHVEK